MLRISEAASGAGGAGGAMIRAGHGFIGPSSEVRTPGSWGQKQGVPLIFAFQRSSKSLWCLLRLKAPEEAGAGQTVAERGQVQYGHLPR